MEINYPPPTAFWILSLKSLRKLEALIINKLRKWYWHFELERMVFEVTFQGKITPIDIAWRVMIAYIITYTIRFFVEDEALLIEDN